MSVIAALCGCCVWHFCASQFDLPRLCLRSPSSRYPRKLSFAAVDLLKKLLEKDPTRRFGGSFNGVAKIKEHPFFAGFNW